MAVIKRSAAWSVPEAFFLKFRKVRNCHEKNTEFRSSYDSKTCIFCTIMPDLVTVRKKCERGAFPQVRDIECNHEICKLIRSGNIFSKILKGRELS